MSSHGGGAATIELHSLDKTASASRFCCGEDSVNAYLRKEAWKMHQRGVHRVTYARMRGDTHLGVCGFYSLASVTELASKIKTNYHLFGHADRFPCLQLVWIGVLRELRGGDVGAALMGQVIQTFAEVGMKIGLPHLILVPINPEVKKFYRDYGFSDYDGGTKMYLPLQTALEAVIE